MFDPASYVIEGLSGGDIINNYGDGGVVDIARDQTAEPFLACSVPELQLDHLVAGLNLLSQKIDSNCCLKRSVNIAANSYLVLDVEGVFGEAQDDRALADGLITEEDNLELHLHGGSLIVASCRVAD